MLLLALPEIQGGPLVVSPTSSLESWHRVRNVGLSSVSVLKSAAVKKSHWLSSNTSVEIKSHSSLLHSGLGNISKVTRRELHIQATSNIYHQIAEEKTRENQIQCLDQKIGISICSRNVNIGCPFKLTDLMKDLVIYEMNVRAFTADKSSGLEPSLRGSYLGLIEKIPHLVELGINAVELLPVFEFDEFEFQRRRNPRDHMINTWGYSTMNFFSPMSRYAADGGGPLAASLQFKEMVKALHGAGIEVILDVVYNHTNEADDEHPYTTSFRGIDNQTNLRKPYHGINFVIAHDGFTLYDLVAYNSKHNDANGEGGRDGSNDNYSWNCGAEGETRDPEVNSLRARQMKNFHMALMVSQVDTNLPSPDDFIGGGIPGIGRVYNVARYSTILLHARP